MEGEEMRERTENRLTTKGVKVGRKNTAQIKPKVFQNSCLAFPRSPRRCRDLACALVCSTTGAAAAGGHSTLTDCWELYQPQKKGLMNHFVQMGSFSPALLFHLKHKEGSERNGVRQFTTCAALLSKFHRLINSSEAGSMGG